MRTLAVSNLYPPDALGGYELACAQAVDALRGAGHEVNVLTAAPRLPVPPAPHVHRRLKLTEDRYWLDPDRRGDDPAALARDTESRLVSAHNVYVLASAVEEFAPDVVYLNNLVGLGGLGLVACLQHLGVPWVWHLGDCVPAELCCFPYDEVVPALAREFTRGVRGHFLAVSRQLCDEIRARGVTLNGPVEVAPYWITGPRGPRARRERGPTLRVMSTGVVNREKGCDILIEAAGLLRDVGHEGFQIDLYGRVADPSLAGLIRRRGLSGHVALRGPRPHAEILERYADYDVFAFPTREREPFGIVPLEAMSRGCVPVITRRCGVAEWLVHGVHCLKTARNAASLAEVLRSVLDGGVDLEPLARRGEAAVWRDFHIDTVLPRIENMLTRAARSPRGPRGSADEAYRLARLAEALTLNLVRQSART